MRVGKTPVYNNHANVPTPDVSNFGILYYYTDGNLYLKKADGSQVVVGGVSASGDFKLKTPIPATGGILYPASTKGDAITISAAGNIGEDLSSAGIYVGVNDIVYCLATNDGGTQAAVGNDFCIIKSATSSIQAPKKYVSVIGQTGTAVPAPIILKNSVGLIVWTRTSAGKYVGTLAGAFTTNKTTFRQSSPIDPTYTILFYRGDSNTVHIDTYISSIAADDVLFNTTIEIGVYQ